MPFDLRLDEFDPREPDVAEPLIKAVDWALDVVGEPHASGYPERGAGRGVECSGA